MEKTKETGYPAVGNMNTCVHLQNHTHVKSWIENGRALDSNGPILWCSLICNDAVQSVYDVLGQDLYNKSGIAHWPLVYKSLSLQSDSLFLTHTGCSVSKSKKPRRRCSCLFSKKKSIACLCPGASQRQIHLKAIDIQNAHRANNMSRFDDTRSI